MTVNLNIRDPDTETRYSLAHTTAFLVLGNLFIKNSYDRRVTSVIVYQQRLKT